MIYKWQFLLRFSILRDKWRQQATSTLLDENLACQFKRETSFTLSKSCMETEQFLLAVKSSRYSQLNSRTWPQSKGRTPQPAVLMRLSCQMVCEWLKLWVVFKSGFAKNRPTGRAVCDTCRLQTCRLADLQTCRLADLQTCRLADLQTCRLVDVQTWRVSTPVVLTQNHF